MPRAGSTEPQRRRHQERQRDYRKRLRDERRPEADAVDAALAVALCRAAAEQKAAEVKDAALKAFLTEALSRARRELLGKGYDRNRATSAIQRRLARAALSVTA